MHCTLRALPARCVSVFFSAFALNVWRSWCWHDDMGDFGFQFWIEWDWHRSINLKADKNYVIKKFFWPDICIICWWFFKTIENLQNLLWRPGSNVNIHTHICYISIYIYIHIYRARLIFKFYHDMRRGPPPFTPQCHVYPQEIRPY